jgi:hypothetical protein
MSIATIASRWLSRRRLIAGAGAVAAGTAVQAAAAGQDKFKDHQGFHDRVEAALAKQEIADLRRQYARATDLIGLNTESSIAAGRAVYHRIFAADAKIGATGQPSVTGPDAWVDIAATALKVYQDTQHLIGTQVVDLESMPDNRGLGGAASMTSYLQAWHAKADGELWLFIGTYHDKLVHTPGTGWQIGEMMLEQVSGDTRQIKA